METNATIVKQAYRMTKQQLVKAIEDRATANGQPYLYGGPGWMTKDELVNCWLNENYKEAKVNG